MLGEDRSKQCVNNLKSTGVVERMEARKKYQ
jgi:hypothetical protein